MSQFPLRVVQCCQPEHFLDPISRPQSYPPLLGPEPDVIIMSRPDVIIRKRSLTFRKLALTFDLKMKFL